MTVAIANVVYNQTCRLLADKAFYTPLLPQGAGYIKLPLKFFFFVYWKVIQQPRTTRHRDYPSSIRDSGSRLIMTLDKEVAVRGF